MAEPTFLTAAERELLTHPAYGVFDWHGDHRLSYSTVYPGDPMQQGTRCGARARIVMIVGKRAKEAWGAGPERSPDPPCMHAAKWVPARLCAAT